MLSALVKSKKDLSLRLRILQALSAQGLPTKIISNFQFYTPTLPPQQRPLLRNAIADSASLLSSAAVDQLSSVLTVLVRQQKENALDPRPAVSITGHLQRVPTFAVRYPGPGLFREPLRQGSPPRSTNANLNFFFSIRIRIGAP